MRALVIEFDSLTGKRAGNINPRDPNLFCRGWQDLDRKPAIEIRLVNDARDLNQYKNVAGVLILDGNEEINEAIKANIPNKYIVTDKELLLAHLKEKGISLNIMAGKTLHEMAEQLFKEGLAGIMVRKPELVD